MFRNKIKAFTIVEIILVVAVIGVLMMATTVYLGGTDEKRKVIEAQGCATTLGSEMTNFVFYTLTSKKLRIDNTPISDIKYYYVSLTGGTDSNCNYGGSGCDTIVFSFSTGDNSEITEYETHTASDSCRGNNSRLRYFRTGSSNNINYVKMNKGFNENEENTNNHKVFRLVNDVTEQDGPITGDIIIGLCLNSECSTPKEISKFAVDGRSQTISVKNCKYYEDNPNKCKTREGCQIYDSTDQSVCLRY